MIGFLLSLTPHVGKILPLNRIIIWNAAFHLQLTTSHMSWTKVYLLVISHESRFFQTLLNSYNIERMIIACVVVAVNTAPLLLSFFSFFNIFFNWCIVHTQLIGYSLSLIVLIHRLVWFLLKKPSHIQSNSCINTQQFFIYLYFCSLPLLLLADRL